MYTMRQAAQLALDVQDACNLSGVVRSFAKVTDTLWEEAHQKGKGTEWVNTHPVAILFVSKLADLSGSERTSEFSRAYAWCRETVDWTGPR